MDQSSALFLADLNQQINPENLDLSEEPSIDSSCQIDVNFNDLANMMSKTNLNPNLKFQAPFSSQEGICQLPDCEYQKVRHEKHASTTPNIFAVSLAGQGNHLNSTKHTKQNSRYTNKIEPGDLSGIVTTTSQLHLEDDQSVVEGNDSMISFQKLMDRDADTKPGEMQQQTNNTTLQIQKQQSLDSLCTDLHLSLIRKQNNQPACTTINITGKSNQISDAPATITDLNCKNAQLPSDSKENEQSDNLEQCSSQAPDQNHITSTTSQAAISSVAISQLKQANSKLKEMLQTTKAPPTQIEKMVTHRLNTNWTRGSKNLPPKSTTTFMGANNNGSAVVNNNAGATGQRKIQPLSTKASFQKIQFGLSRQQQIQSPNNNNHSIGQKQPQLGCTLQSHRSNSSCFSATLRTGNLKGSSIAASGPLGCMQKVALVGEKNNNNMVVKKSTLKLTIPKDQHLRTSKRNTLSRLKSQEQEPSSSTKTTETIVVQNADLSLSQLKTVRGNQTNQTNQTNNLSFNKDQQTTNIKKIDQSQVKSTRNGGNDQALSQTKRLGSSRNLSARGAQVSLASSKSCESSQMRLNATFQKQNTQIRQHYLLAAMGNGIHR